MDNEHVRVLLIEDDEDDYLLTRHLLDKIESPRFDVTWVSAFDDGLETAARNQHDVVLVDYRLGVQTGVALVREAVAQGCRSPIIMLTGQSDHQTDLDAMEAGTADYLEKDGLSARLLERSIRYALERRRAEEALRESEERFRATFEQLTVGMAYPAPSGQWQRVNPKLCEILGYSAEELQERTWQEMTHPDDLEADASQARQAVAGELESYSMEKRFIRKDGTPVWTHLTTSLVRDKAGDVKYGVAIIEDITARKQIEAAHRESEARFRAMNESAPLGIFLTNPNGECIYTNIKYQALTGLSFEEALGNGWSTAIYLEDRDRVFNEWYQAAEQQTLYESVHRYARKDGSSIWASVKAAAVRDGDRLLGYVGTAEDITQRREAEATLEQERTLLRTLIDALPDYIFIKDADGRFIISNEAHAWAVNAATPELLIGKTAFEFFPPELAAQYDADDRAIMESGKPLLNLERQTVNPDGSRIWVSTTKMPLRDADGKVTGLVGISRNVTERKAAEEALRESEASYRRIVETATEGIWVINAEGITSFVNQRMADMLGYTLEELQGQAIFDFMDAESGTIQNQDDYKFRHKDGRVLWGIGSISVLMDKDGEYSGVLVMVTDITERKQAETALRASEERYRALTELTSDYAYAYRVEPDGTFTHEWITDSFTRITGYRQEEIDALGSFALYHPDDAPIAARHIEQVLRGETSGGEIRIITKSGETRWLHIHRRPVLEGERVVRFYGVAQDITERKRANEALRESETRYRLVAQATNDAIWDWNLMADTMTWSGAVTALFGYIPEEIALTMDWWAERVHPEDRDTVQTSVYAVVQGSGHYWSAEYRFRRADGTYALVIDRAFVARDDTGKPLRMIGSTMDVTERKQAEEAVRESEKRFRALFDQTNDAVFIIGLDAVYQMVNQRGAEMMGYEVDELVGKPIQAVAPATQHDHQKRTQEKLLSGERIAPYERLFQRKDGTTFPCEVNVELVRDANGEPLHIQSVVRDITERKQAEEALDEQRNLLRTLMDALPDFIYVKDIESRYLLNNIAHARSMGVENPEELVGKGDFEYFPPEMASQFYADEQQMLRTAESLIQREERSLGVDGNVIWAESTKVPLRDKNGQIIGLVGMTRDISERKQADEALARERNLLRTVLDTIPDAVYIKDAEGRFITCNERQAMLCGVDSPEQLIGLTDLDLFPDKGPEYFTDEFYVLLSGEPLVDKEEPFGEKIGVEGWHLTTKVPLQGADGAIIGLVGIGRDITERKRAEQALRASEVRFRANFEQAAVGSTHTGMDGRFLRVNQKFCDIVGYTYEEISALTWQEITHPDDLSLDLESTQRLLDGKISTFSMEERYLRRDGSSIWVNATLSLVRTGEGDPDYFIAVVEDISQRKRAEEALKNQQAFLRQVIDANPNLIFVKDWEGRFTLVNKAHADLMGVTVEEMLGKRDADFGIPHEEVEHFLENDREVMRTREAKFIPEEKLTSPFNEEIRWLETVKVPLIVPDGAPQQMLGVATDITERKLANERLRESEARFRLLFEHSPDAVILVDPYDAAVLCPIVDCNNAACVMNGYTREELIGHTVDLLNTEPGNRADLPDYLESIRQAGVLIEEATHWHKDGKLVHIQTHTVLVNLNGRELLLGIDRDITERKRAEEALRESEVRFRANFEQAAVGVSHTNMEGRYIRINQKFCDIVGYTHDEIMALSWQAVTHSDDHDIDSAYVRQLLARQIGTYTMEKRYIRKNGAYIWANLTVSLVRTAGGEPDYFIGVIEDITERKRTEEALSQTHLKLEAAYDTTERLIQQTPIGIQVFDSSGLCVDVNQAHLDMFGVGSREDEIGRYNIFGDIQAQATGTQDGARRALDGEIVHLGDLTFDFDQAQSYATTNRGMRFINVSFFPIFDADGNIQRVVALNQDVTERKQVEVQQVELAAERARMKVVERFVQDASHDLRTPLTIMQTSAYLLAKSNDPERREHHLANLDDQMAHITRVLQNFLDLSRLDQLMTELHLEPCDLNVLVNGICGEQHALAGRKGHLVQMDLSDTLPSMMGDRVELQRALRHLIVNALNYTPDGGTISLVTYREGDYAVFEVRDTGIGINAGEIPYIFEHFYRADQARGTDTGGAGLGLTIAKKIVEAHKGRIEVDSTPGEGSVFRVYLPL